MEKHSTKVRPNRLAKEYNASVRHEIINFANPNVSNPTHFRHNLYESALSIQCQPVQWDRICCTAMIVGFTITYADWFFAGFVSAIHVLNTISM